MGRLDWALRRRIESSGIPNHKIDELVEHLQSNFPDYRRMKNFNKRVESTLKSSTQKPQKFNFDEDDDNTDGTNSVTITPTRSPARKKHRKLDASEQRLQRKEAQHIITRRRRRKKEFDNRHSTMTSSGSTSSSEEDVTPEFDFTKSMLRSSYAKNAVAAKVEEERNMEVEVDSKAKKANSSSGGRGAGKGEEVRKSGPRFKDIGGIKGVLEKLIDEVIVPLKSPELPRWLGVKPITGILLKGPPGCGKTKLAHAIANETGVPFYKISATEVVSGVSGASEENIRDLFSKAYRTAPSIVFIDEIDAIASKRESLQREMERRIVTQLMTCMDESHQSIVIPDTESNSGTSDKKPAYVLVIGATNRPDALDPALRRPGRFDQEIDLGVPDEKARVEILKVLTANLRLDGALDLDKIARFTPGFVGADLAALANKAGNLAMKRIINRRRAEISGEPPIEESNEDWWMRPWTPEEMEKLSITMSDFEDASKIVQPSSRREGFSAIPNVKWEDVGGLDFLRKEFERYIVRRIKHPEDYEFFGADMGTGFLLYGPPGCGKTLIAKAVANESGANFIHIKGPEILNKYVGESEMAIRTIFSRARTCAPCILFFDEVDALTTQRGLEGGHVVERLLNQLLIELDGAGERRGVYVIGATNRLEVMDRAVLRPGRFGKLLHVPLPGPDQRGWILRALARDKPIDKNVDLFSIGRTDSCEKLSGADLAAVMNEAAMAAMEEKHMLDPGNHDTRSWTIKAEHFEQALKKVSPSVSDEQIKYYKGISRTFKTA